MATKQASKASETAKEAFFIQEVGNEKRQKNETRYMVTDVASIPVCRIGRKRDAYMMVTDPGSGLVNSAGEEVHLKDAPKQSETGVIIVSDDSGFSIWAKDITDIKIFVTYDKNGLIDTYRLGIWSDKPYDDETEISFSDLQSEYDYENTSRAEIMGTWEYQKKLEEVAV